MILHKSIPNYLKSHTHIGLRPLNPALENISELRQLLMLISQRIILQFQILELLLLITVVILEALR
jgi:hypothetical protein